MARPEAARPWLFPRIAVRPVTGAREALECSIHSRRRKLNSYQNAVYSTSFVAAIPDLSTKRCSWRLRDEAANGIGRNTHLPASNQARARNAYRNGRAAAPGRLPHHPGTHPVLQLTYDGGR